MVVSAMVMISLEHDLWSLWFKLVSLGGWLLKLDQLNGFKGFVGTSWSQSIESMGRLAAAAFAIAHDD